MVLGTGFYRFFDAGARALPVALSRRYQSASCRSLPPDIAANGLADRVSVYLSDNLKSIPPAERWDLVVSNPPHFADDYIGDSRGHDPDWRIHREFFSTVSAFLKPGGVIVLQENTAGSTVETFRDMIAEAGLSIVFVQGCPPQRTPDHRFYYIGIVRSGDPVPAWARLN